MRTMWLTLWRCGVVAGLVILQGCADFGGYDAAFGRLDHTPQHLPAAIQVSAPQLYKREALINERKDELAYLQQKLKESESIVIGAELVRDIEVISALTAQLGLSFDAGIRQGVDQASQLKDLEQQIAALKLQAQLGQLKRDLELMQAAYASQTTPSAPAGTSPTSTTVPTLPKPDLPALSQLDTLVKSVIAGLEKASTAPRDSKGVSAPIDIFRDRQAYRRVLQSEINAVSLDDLHDYEGNSLFRMQFRATVLPGDARVDKSLGILRMQVRRPVLAQDSTDLAALYRRWLDHITLRLNEGLHKNTTGASPSLLMMGSAKQVFSVISIQVPRAGAGGACPAEIRLDSIQVPDQACLVVRIAVPPVGGAPADANVGVAASPVTVAAVQPPQPVFSPGAVASVLRPDSPDKGWSAMVESAGSSVKSAPPAVDGRGKPPPATAQQASSCEANQPLYEDQKKSIRSGYTVRRSTLRFTVSRIADEFADFKPSEMNAIYRLIDEAAQCAIKVQQDLGQGQAPAVTASTQRPDKVPDAFYQALFDEKGIARGRVAAYAVTPAELAQRISTAARAGSAVQMAASLSAILPAKGVGANTALGYARAASGKADTLERIPLVVGYVEPGDTETEAQLDRARLLPGFGWLLGPKVVINPEGKSLALEHHLAPYDLTADVVMPGWWPHFDIDYQSEWAPGWQGGQALAAQAATGRDAAGQAIPSNQRAMRVPRRLSRGDLDGIVTLLLKSSGDPRVEIASVGRVEPSTISACAGQVNLLVQGINIWRTQSAYLYGMASTSITVLPDMSGVSLGFDLTKLPQRPSQFVEPRLTLMTPNGWASAPITIDGSRLGSNGCGSEGLARSQPDDGQPYITAVLPSRLYSCDTSQRLVIRGRNLQGAGSVYLGGLAATSFVAGADVTATFGLIDRHGGRQSTTLPVIVMTERGVASREITIERDNCKEVSKLDAEASAAQRAADKK